MSVLLGMRSNDKYLILVFRIERPRCCELSFFKIAVETPPFLFLFLLFFVEFRFD